MSEAVKALLQKLGGLVPGYAGYADRERRRETDQALRLAVSARLGSARAALERRAADASRAGRFDLLDPLDALARRTATLADAVRHAPAGYAGLFDAAAVDAASLDRLYEADLAVREACERLAGAAEELPPSPDPGGLARVEAALADADGALRLRGESLREVK